LRPYIDLNPYAILSLPSTATDEDVRKQYRLISRYVHPDKNEGNLHAKKAFELLNKAYKTLQDPSEVAFVRQVIEEATKRVDDDLKIKKKEYKRRIGRKKGSGKVEYPREIVLKGKDPDRYEALIQYMTCKVFVELDDRRRRAIDLEVANKKRKREEDQEKVEKMKQEAEFQKKWEEGREERVSSWREHQKGTLFFFRISYLTLCHLTTAGPGAKKSGGATKRKRTTMLRPPKLKTETRN